MNNIFYDKTFVFLEIEKRKLNSQQRETMLILIINMAPAMMTSRTSQAYISSYLICIIMVNRNLCLVPNISKGTSKPPKENFLIILATSQKHIESPCRVPVHMVPERETISRRHCSTANEACLFTFFTWK